MSKRTESHRVLQWAHQRQWALLLALFAAISGTYLACAVSGDDNFDESSLTGDAGPSQQYDGPSSNNGPGKH